MNNSQALISQTAAKNQHIIPQTYMRNWCYSGDSVWTINKNKRPYEIVNRNIESINSINYHYDIKAGDLFTTEDSLDHIFGLLDTYEVYYESEKLDKTLMNKNFYYFDNWVINHADGRAIKRAERNIIKSKLRSSRYSFIEIEWSAQYENDWNDFINDVQRKAISMKSGGQDQLSQDDLDVLMKYLIMFDWRSKSGNSILNEIIDWFCKIMPEFKTTEIPLQDRIHREDEAIIDELRHALLRKAYYEFLNDAGSMKTFVDSYLQHLTFVFCITDNSNPFITSDNPSYVFKNKQDRREHVLVALPTLLLTTCKMMGEGSIIILNLTADEVTYYNKITAENGEQLILPKNDMDLSSFIDIR